MTTWRGSRRILVNGSWFRHAKGAGGQQERTVETRGARTGDRKYRARHRVVLAGPVTGIRVGATLVRCQHRDCSPVPRMWMID
jgi:hypothetical protein